MSFLIQYLSRRLIMLTLYVFVSLLPNHMAFAQDAALGPTYPVAEPDMIQEIQNKLKAMKASGRLSQLQKEAVARSERHIETPVPVAGLRTTDHPRTFYFDPSWHAPHDVVTPDGHTIVHAGQVVNPLDYVSLSSNLVFFDGRDPAQVARVADLIRLYSGRVKAIMVAGEPLKLTRAWKRQIYFDQGGTLIRRFGIRQVPAVVSQDTAQKRLRVDEILPQDKE
jgi:conjugal transfer pilus assembly protein TraW